MTRVRKNNLSGRDNRNKEKAGKEEREVVSLCVSSLLNIFIPTQIW